MPQELQRVIDYDRKLRDFMSRKNQERSEAHEEMEARKRRKEAEKASTRERTVLVRGMGRWVYSGLQLTSLSSSLLPSPHSSLLFPPP